MGIKCMMLIEVMHINMLHESIKVILKATLGVLTINLLWLLPMAYLAATKVIMPELVIAIAYFPLIVLAIYFKAGKQKMSNKILY